MRDTGVSSILKKIRIIFLLVPACLSLHVTAGDDNHPVSSTNDHSSARPWQPVKPVAVDALENQDQAMEEITVIGQRYISSLRVQIIQAEDRAYDIFNRLNEDDDYDVHCHMVAPTGTLIRKRLCLPNFYHKATADEAQMFLSFIGATNYSPAVPSVANIFSAKFPVFKSKVKKIASKNPDFLNALQDLYELNQELKRARDVYHGVNDK